MKASKGVVGKILSHSEGLGVPTRELVESRAREIAYINGHQHVNAHDKEQAWAELHGGHPGANGDEESESVMVSERDMVAGANGHHNHRNGHLSDEVEDVVGELIAEGMDEALHEQMLASRRANDEEDEEENAEEREALPREDAEDDAP